jgi:replicative DNA helicase
MEQTIEQMLEACNKDIALIEDKEKRRAEFERIKELSRKYRGEDEVVSVEDIISQLDVEKRKNPFKLMTKIPKLDDIIDGFRDGNLVVVSGPTGNGKTLLCQTLTDTFTKDETNCLWFSYEVPIAEFVEKFDVVPTFFVPKQMKGNTMEWIEKKVVEGIAKHDTKVIFIDHLHYLFDISAIGRGINSSIAIGGIMRELKKIAIKWNVIIFLVAHIGKTITNEAPGLDAIRDSSFIAQEADLIVMVSRYKTKDKNDSLIYKDESRISVEKNRRTGKTGWIDVKCVNNKLIEFAPATYESEGINL